MIIRTVTGLLVILASCKAKSEDPALIGELTDNLEVSTRLIKASTALSFDVLWNRTLEPEYQQRAMIWEPKARKLRIYTTSLILYIDTLKAGIRETKNKDQSREWDKEQGRLLFNRLDEYRKLTLSIDPELSGMLTSKGLFNDFRQLSPSEFQSVYFAGSKDRRLAHLVKLENQVRVTENRVVSFCYENTGTLDGYGFYSSFSAIIGQSANIVSPGSEIEIVAGIGSFSRSAMPLIWVDGKKVPLADDGPARFKFNASPKPGNYRTEVMIHFIDQEGRKQQLKKTLEYTVADILLPEVEKTSGSE